MEKLKLVHSNFYGAIALATPGGRHYFLLLVDNISRYMWVILLDTKAATSDTIKRHQAAVECGRKLRVLRTDNCGKFTAAKFAAYWADEGIQRHYSASYISQQNRHRRAPQPDGGGHRSCPPQAEGDASHLLG
jgi:hypothetical protein